MTHLNVAVRVRPLSEREIEFGSVPAVMVENNVIAVTNIKVPEQNTGDSRERVRRFGFDFCFEQETTQDQVFDTVEAVIGKSLRNRQNSCVLAYGQSSSGKTHTMMGFPHDPGLTPKLCSKVFEYFQEAATADEIGNMKISASYLEIYNEKVTDLLIEKSGKQPNDKARNLKIREHPKKGPYVQGLLEHKVTTPSELLTWLETGNNRRRVGRTLTNPRSSRSHSVFCISCDGVKLHLVDLAGSEKTGSRCYENSRFREGANINKSLVALGNVISALAEQSKALRRRFVPFRDSALTWLLKDTLGGNSNTFMIATVSASSACHSETVNTLRFGQRAKLIVLRPVTVEDPKEKTIRELRTEIAKLRELLRLSKIAPYLYCETPMSQTTEIVPNIIHKIFNENEDIDEVATTSKESLSDNNLSPSQNFTETPQNKEVLKECSENALKQTCINSENNLNELNKTNFNLVKEKLLPLMNVVSKLDETKPIQPLSKTFSMDRPKSRSSYSSQESLAQQSPKRNKKLPPLPLKPQSLSKSNSQESLTSPNQRKTVTPPSRRSSITKPSLKTIAQKKVLGPTTTTKKPEKPVATETTANVSKTDPAKKTVSVPKPRSQLLAALTNRLHNAGNKKDTDTPEGPTRNEVPKELAGLSIEARMRLKELTQKALRAHKHRNREIQTERPPVLRMKEVYTDSRDLKLVTKIVKDAETLNKPDFKDVSVECKLEDEKEIVETRSCGTQSTEQINPTNPISFTKYLMDPQHSITSPIYTGAVNINISHNYLNNSAVNSVSDEGLDGTHNNVNFPTPDLISNHNSLEKHAVDAEPGKSKQNIESKVSFANFEHFFPATGEIIQPLKPTKKPERKYAKLCYVFPNRERMKNVNLIGTYAPQTCVIDNFMKEYSIPLKSFRPVLGRARVQLVDLDSSKLQETVSISDPLVVSYLNHENPALRSEEHCYSPKRISPKKERMFKAMSDFLVEATTLMTNLSAATESLKTRNPLLEDSYQLQLTVNDGCEELKKHIKYNQLHKSCSTQCDRVLREDSCSQTILDDGYVLPINKYNELLEDSCKRLEHKIGRAPRSRRTTVSDDCQNEFWPVFSQPAYNPWDMGNSGPAEDSSLESNPVTFSDYGSLPRKTHKRQRTPTCSPSAFLKQLTNMRRQVIETSREEFCGSSNR